MRIVNTGDATFLVRVGEEHKTRQADTEIRSDRLETAARAYLTIPDVEREVVRPELQSR